MLLSEYYYLKDQFYENHRAISFLWLHPSQGITYEVRFASSPITQSEEGVSPFVAKVDCQLQPLGYAPNEQYTPSIGDLMATVTTGADKAVQAALEAKDSKEAASQSMSAAAISASEATESAQAAADAVANIGTSVEDAAQSAVAASASAATASGKADEAAASASTAQTAADTATAQASSASASAKSAATSAGTASTKATDASTSASAASSSAATAATKANEASASAQRAQDAANSVDVSVLIEQIANLQESLLALSSAMQGQANSITALSNRIADLENLTIVVAS